MFLTNSLGRVMDFTDEEATQHLNRGTLRLSTDEEVALYQANEEVKVLNSKKGNKQSVYFQTISRGPNGYGMSREYLEKELFKLGLFLTETYDDQKVGLLYNYPNGIVSMRNDIRLVFTMFESNKIPDDWVEYLQQADEVLVPSRFCQETFKKSGVDSTVVPLGYNEDIFTYQDRQIPVENDGIFTFIHYNSFNMRKGFQEVLSAFKEEFDIGEPVRLVLKTTSFETLIPILPSQFPNIQVIKDQMSEKDLKELLGKCHCMLFPSRGEGFGLTPLEAMATGMPAIVPNAHGIAEYFNKDYMLEVKLDHMEPALNRRFMGQYIGENVVCSVEDLRKQMRYAFSHQREMKELGKKASEYVKKYTYRKTAKHLFDILTKWQQKNVVKRRDTKHLKVTRV